MAAVDDADTLAAWAEALWQAFVLAKGERGREIRGERKVRTFDSQGLHPYSMLWGRVLTCEFLLPELAHARDHGEPVCTPITMRALAARAAEEDFAEQARAGQEDLWAHA